MKRNLVVVGFKTKEEAVNHLLLDIFNTIIPTIHKSITDKTCTTDKSLWDNAGNIYEDLYREKVYNFDRWAWWIVPSCNYYSEYAFLACSEK